MGISGWIDCWCGLITSFLCRGKGDLVVKGTATFRGWQHLKKFPLETASLPFRAGLQTSLGESLLTGKVCLLSPLYSQRNKGINDALSCAGV